MADILIFINGIILIGISLFFLILGMSSFNEKEYRAAIIALFRLILNGLFWTGFLLAPPRFQTVNILILSSIALFILISLMRFFPDKSIERDLSKEPLAETMNFFQK